MAETRIEKYKEYRKSIISNGDLVLKTPIDTSLKTTSKESVNIVTEQEAVFLRKINHRKAVGNIFYIIFALALAVPLIVMGIIIF